MTAQIINWPHHKLHRCGDRCDGCQFCNGGLALCEVCGGAEATLPTECPGVRLTNTQETQVMEGILDYRNGAWGIQPGFKFTDQQSA